MTKKNNPGGFKPGGPNPGFKPGHSGNPGGRPKIDQEVRRLAQEMSVEAIHTLGDIMRDTEGDKRVRAMAANSILDRAVGKPVQAIAHTGEINTGAPMADLMAQLPPEVRAALAAVDPRIGALAGTTH